MCDPVLGDNGKLYVPAELIKIYRDTIIPLADIAIPNQFEAELLSKIPIKSEDNAWEALKWFHNKGVKTVVISSVSLGKSSSIKAFLSIKTNLVYEQYTIEVPILGNGLRFGGTGDLFAALFLAHSEISKSFSIALEKTSATLHEVINNTLNQMSNEVLLFRKPCQPEDKELKLVQSKSAIENPRKLFVAIRRF